MEQSLMPAPTKDTLLCLLCARCIPAADYDRHIAMHEQAEMLADILALSRR